MKKTVLCLVALAAILVLPAAMAEELDLGKAYEKLLSDNSQALFGFGTPLANSASEVIDRAPGQPATERQLLAEGLQVSFVSRSVAYKADMIAFWPDDINYTHLMVCNEDSRKGSTPGGGGGLNSSVQRIELATGEVTTILYGMSRCDGIRTTQWGTVLATEENGADGGAYEIINPLATNGHWVADRGGQGGEADIRDGLDSANPSSSIVKRTALVAQSWEGLEVLDNGVVIGGDELRPGLDNDGGSIFRFVPKNLYECEGAPVRPGQLCQNTIESLDQSPLAEGQNYALATVCSGTDDFGQGCEYGRGVWVEVRAGFARADAAERGGTGYCRPEDLHVDRSYGIYDGGEGIRYCWTNTCGGLYGETLCAVEDQMDATAAVFNDNFGYNLLSSDGDNPSQALVTRFVQGDSEMNSHDNLDIQPFTSNVYVIEDNRFGDVWGCLQDGDDRDNESDGCVRLLSINSRTAEPSGFIFDGTGRTAFYHLQHGQQVEGLYDWDSNRLDGQTDDLMMITGFETAGVPAKIKFNPKAKIQLKPSKIDAAR